MALFVERAAADRLTGAELVEQLAAYLAGRYQAAETYLLAEIARRVVADMNVDSLTRRAASIRELRIAAERVIRELNTDELARRILHTAITEGEQAAIEQLGFTAAARGGTTPAFGFNGEELPFSTGLTPAAAAASAQLGFQLASDLRDVSERILRLVPDVYQQTVARFAGERLLGVRTGRQTRTATVADFLGQGIGGFVDRSGRRWRIGSYVEMATRTATNRAWLEAHVARFGSIGLNLVTIVRGSDACRACAAWSGKVLSTNGITGTIQAVHATTGEPVTVTVVGTLATARAGGWNHPNCRCTLAAVFPGLSLPADDSTYDPDAEKNRDRLRYLERQVRDAKRKAEIAAALGDDVSAAGYRRDVRRWQERIRIHVSETGQVRKPYREQLIFSDGAPASIPALPPAAVQ